MATLPARVLYTGTEEPLRESRELRAGVVSVLYEEGSLRYLRWGSREMLRRVYVAVRDRNWGTVPAALSDVKIDAGSDSFQISFAAECKRNEIHFVWKGAIKGDAKGTIVFSMDGEAKTTFFRNRIGFCILHPIRECAGRPVVIERTSGAINRGSFPRYIWAQQPFQDLRAISHEVAPGVRARVAFEGDTFEMEDQRNWADASYKIYSTPLQLPFPVEVKRGTRITQTVTFSVEGASAPSVVVPDAHTISVGSAAACPLPRLGLAAASHGKPLTQAEVALLKALHLHHLRVDVTPSQPDAQTTLLRAVNEARALGIRLELAIHLSDAGEQELKALIPVLVRTDAPLASWLVFPLKEKCITQRWADAAREILIPFHPELPLGAGTDAYFAELNRGQLPKGLELLSYSVNPQVHASDNRTVVENLEGFEATVESARLLGKDQPLAIGPVTLRPRFNPYATGPEPEPPAGDLPARVDSRQMSLFGAGWTMGSLKALAKTGVHSLTYFETSGRLGVIEREKDPPMHVRFPSMPGWVFPMYHVLADVGEFAGGGSVLPWTSANDLSVTGIGLTQSGKTRILLANLTENPQKVRLACPLFKGVVRVKRLDETNVLDALSAPAVYREAPGEPMSGQPLELDLRPYAIVRIDG